MAKEFKLNLPSADSLFTTQEERDQKEKEVERIIYLKSSEISDFPDHPFQVKMDEAMSDMIDSISEYGVLVPALVRPKKEGGYEMVAGHRRKCAAGLAGLEEIPCIVRDLTDDEATIVMVDSNLQREEILPSERAFAYKMKLEALKRQGARTDLTSSQDAKELSADLIGKEFGKKKDTVYRYIRLTRLIPPILEMVDAKKIAITPAEKISFLPREMQEVLFDAMECEDCTPSGSQAIKIKNFYEEGRLNEDVIFSILQEEKPNQKDQVRIPQERISMYFSKGASKKEIENTIVKALELYRKRQRTMER